MTIEDGDGRLHRIEGGRGLFVGDGQRIEVPLRGTGRRQPTSRSRARSGCGRSS